MTDKSDSKPRDYNYICFIDVETTGRDLLKHDMVCFAAVIMDIKTGNFIDEFKVYLKPKSGTLNWEKRCQEEFWNAPKNIENTKQTLINFEKYAVPIEVGMEQFFKWINLRHWINNDPENRKKLLDNMIICTDTAGYDIAWINRYLSEANLETDCCYIIQDEYKPTRDTNSFYFGIAKSFPEDGLYKCEKKALSCFGLSHERFDLLNPYKHDHDPINDAKHMAWSYKTMKCIVDDYKKGGFIDNKLIALYGK